MSNWHEAQWTNGEIMLTGRWYYERFRDVFHIHLDSRDEITGQNRKIETHNDSPEWGKWKLIERASA